jgi:hypothetical protein
VSIALCIAGILNSSAANWITAVKGAFSFTFKLMMKMRGKAAVRP